MTKPVKQSCRIAAAVHGLMKGKWANPVVQVASGVFHLILLKLTDQLLG